jgi:hypothetical protein
MKKIIVLAFLGIILVGCGKHDPVAPQTTSPEPTIAAIPTTAPVKITPTPTITFTKTATPQPTPTPTATIFIMTKTIYFSESSPAQVNDVKVLSTSKIKISVKYWDGTTLGDEQFLPLTLNGANFTFDTLCNPGWSNAIRVFWTSKWWLHSSDYLILNFYVSN